jgi:cyanate permease
VVFPFSRLVGWDIGTVVLFWFIITPALALYLPTLTSKRKNTLPESIAGILISYALMVFMIYDHYQTDMFLMIMISCGFNLIVMYVIFIVWKTIEDDDRNRKLAS